MQSCLTNGWPGVAFTAAFRISKRQFCGSVSACLVLSALGCSSKPVPVANTTPSGTIQSLQASGQLPVLDVTTSLTGTDADGDGVRDDLDKYIAALPDSAVQKKALLQLAAGIQATLSVDATSSTALSAASMALNRGDACVWQMYAGASPTLRVHTLEELTINTQPRLVAYEGYNAARTGATVTAPTGTVCN
jgi:hypothetical protein